MLRALLTFGMTVMPDPPFSRMLKLIQLAEQNGFEYGWTYDSHILWQESYALLPIVARETKTIKLGHCVTNPGIRDPTITASWYATMQDLSDGRMVMGIGRGDSSRRVVGL
jgi:alkanesulfonate monooxygenase SsuD/methylene tetrahydromethanopterin reductase-like flavin-dependent oxidoreductase (luciferase family)